MSDAAPEEYFYQDHGGIYGPVSLNTLKERVAKGAMPDDILIRKGNGPWLRASDYGIYGGPPEKVTPAAHPPQRSGGWAKWVLAAVVGAGIAYWLWEPGFSSADISAAAADIRREYEKREGVKVEDVSLIKKSASELTGFVRLNVLGMEVFHTCSATADARGQGYIWQCAPR